MFCIIIIIIFLWFMFDFACDFSNLSQLFVHNYHDPVDSIKHIKNQKKRPTTNTTHVFAVIHNLNLSLKANKNYL